MKLLRETIVASAASCEMCLEPFPDDGDAYPTFNGVSSR